MHYSSQTPTVFSRWRSFGRLRVLTLIFMLGATAFTLSSRAFGEILIRDVTPVDAHSGVMETQDALISDGKIVAMGQGLAAPSSVTVIDGKGRFLTPGLWDMHVHLSYDDRFVDLMPDLFLDYGITSVRDTGGNLDRLLPILKSRYASSNEAPRVFYAGPLLDGSPVVYGSDDGDGIGEGTVTTEQARSRVQELRAAGVSFIKIYEMVTPEIFDAFADEASKVNLPIAAHVPLSMLASDAGPRVQSMEHLRNIEMDCARDARALLKERREMLAAGRERSSKGMDLRSSIHKSQRDPAVQNEDPERCDWVLDNLVSTIQVPTARLNAMTQYPPFSAEDWPLALQALPDSLRNDWLKAPQYMDPNSYRVLGEWTLAMIPRLAAKNIAIGAGTDTPIGWAIPGYSLHRELEILVAAGLNPRSALAAATLVPASFFSLAHQTGRVAEGYQADLLLLDANPLEDIRNTRRISAVISKGNLVRDRAME
ncbi:amidohydrolase family protein [Congregibacter brevis]|uniref:Amidohydrolase family protein n=1 Tax=Congregibacter brevis TaxID=3081201 RepID=A0ABZ0I9L4_9GAMM|nr:amidohydrolase family protein [Congregibacter sp. IMCC45268]